jgi:hypothetical protein
VTQDQSFLPETVLRRYFHAKDENRPHLLDSTFTSDAVLEVRNSSSAIAFPAVTRGRVGIAKVLVRDFGQTYENLYSFYMRRPHGQLREFSCDWLVAMTEKATSAVRVGSGRYDWSFAEAVPHLATKLTISIADMQVLPAATMPAVFDWIAQLAYPWSSREEVLASAPHLPDLRSVLDYLAQREGDA